MTVANMVLNGVSRRLRATADRSRKGNGTSSVTHGFDIIYLFQPQARPISHSFEKRAHAICRQSKLAAAGGARQVERPL